MRFNLPGALSFTSAIAVSPKTSAPVDNPARGIWVTETALTTALNTAYFAESTATFVIVMGIAMFLTGIGFLVLTLGVLRGPAAVKDKSRTTPAKAVAVPH